MLGEDIGSDLISETTLGSLPNLAFAVSNGEPQFFEKARHKYTHEDKKKANLDNVAKDILFKTLDKDKNMYTHIDPISGTINWSDEKNDDRNVERSKERSKDRPMRMRRDKKPSRKHDRKVLVAEESTKSWADSDSESSSSSSSSSDSEQEEVHCLMADQTSDDEVSDLVARDFVYSSEVRYGCELVLQRRMWHGYMCLLADLLYCVFYSMLLLEDERVTPVYLISMLGSVSHYERSGQLSHLMSWVTAV
ncbi:hypothetical protein F511_08011 [Dorcoceras hygrometricum]|uniref:Uncharacterized protein n=1 Tax=Dorcoceras hygrometricum TaxID=472368 RepID=A0A2Z7CEZ9_9LAMI|nr:hypothetical protein F511_08011 [Dorcoceras hygrometricum]